MTNICFKNICVIKYKIYVTCCQSTIRAYLGFRNHFYLTVCERLKVFRKDESRACLNGTTLIISLIVLPKLWCL